MRDRTTTSQTAMTEDSFAGLEDKRNQDIAMILEAFKKNDTSWHLDKRVPVSLIFVLIIQSVSIVWWASQAESRIAHIERGSASERWVAEVSVRLDSIEADLSATSTSETLDLHFQNLERVITNLENRIEVK